MDDMTTYLTETKRIEMNKRMAFLGVSGIGLFLSLFSSAFLGVPILAIGAYLGVKWFQYRAQNGIRF